MKSNRSRIFAVVVIATLVMAAPASAAISNLDKKQNKELKTLRKSAAALRTDLDKAKADLAARDSAFDGYVDSSEYGVVVLYLDQEGDGFEANDAVPGAVLTTADLPDNADQATVSGTLTVLVPNGTTARQIALKAGIRSGENDGTGVSDPAGQAGLVAMTASMVGIGTSLGGGHISATQLPLSSAPNAMLGGLRVYDIPGKSALATASPNPLSFPNDQMIELTDPAKLENLTGTPPGRYTVTNVTGTGAYAIFNVTVRFTDLSTSTTDLQE